MPAKYVIGLDYGTNSARALLVEVATGAEIAAHTWIYTHGSSGVVRDHKDPNLARQYPPDYLTAITQTIRGVLKLGRKHRGFKPENVIGIGVDTTGSTPMPVDASGNSLVTHKEFANNPAAMAWLWKDHTGHAEAAEITTKAAKLHPEYLAKCGGRYSSEWFWSKILHCARVAPKVFDAAYTWVEIADWIPAVLTGTTHPELIRRGICAAGHKAMCNPEWGGYPDAKFLATLDPRLARVRESLPDKTFTVADAAGTLSDEWAETLGLPAGIPVAVGAFDAHLGAVGSGIAPGTFVKIIGTSTCDIMVAPLARKLPDIPGLCGIVPESVLPGFYGLEAGQSAVGDIFNWFVNIIQPGGKNTHETLTAAAEKLRPGESGLLSLDWHNGNRTVLVDQRLTGLILGLTLHSTPAEIYRALVEATAFGSRAIVERHEEYGIKVERIVNCGGIAAKNPMVMQIYADIIGRPIAISRSSQTCALGSAVAAAVVAGKKAGGYDNFAQATKKMTGIQKKVFKPNPKAVAVYNGLYKLYQQLHDSFGIKGHEADISNVMKDLLAFRDAAR